MVEAGVSAAIAAIAGFSAISNRLHKRISDLDSRVDRLQLTMAESYVSKSDHAASMLELKEHMIRIENKLDSFIQHFPKR